MLKLDTDDKVGHAGLWLRFWVSCLTRGNHSNDFFFKQAVSLGEEIKQNMLRCVPEHQI